MLSLRRASRGERTNVKARKKQGEKCENRGEKERGQWEKGWENNEKCKGGEGSTWKRIGLKGGNCGEGCGGDDRGVP